MGRYYETFYPPFFMDLSYRHDAIAQNRSGYNRDDKAIVDDIKRTLLRLIPLNTSDITISSMNQVVTLQGTAPSKAFLIFLAKMADRVLGVRQVINKLEIKRVGAEAKPENSKTPQKESYFEPQTTFSEL